MAILGKIKNNLFVVITFWCLSLVASIILYYFLDSVAKVEYEGISLAGSIAVFYIVYKLLSNSYFKQYSLSGDESKPVEERIEILEGLIQKSIQKDLFNNFNIPHNYKPEISNEFKFGFCYPENWKFSKFPQQILYGYIQNFDSFEEDGFITNYNLSISDISESELSVNEFYESGHVGLLDLMPHSKLKFSEPCIVNGLNAQKFRIDYVDNKGQEITLYQIQVADKNKKRMFFNSFTTLTSKFDYYKNTFENILNTLRF